MTRRPKKCNSRRHCEQNATWRIGMSASLPRPRVVRAASLQRSANESSKTQCRDAHIAHTTRVKAGRATANSGVHVGCPELSSRQHLRPQHVPPKKAGVTGRRPGLLRGSQQMLPAPFNMTPSPTHLSVRASSQRKFEARASTYKLFRTRGTPLALPTPPLPPPKGRPRQRTP